MPGSPEEPDWLATRNAAMVGIATAEHYKWSVGQEVELRGAVPPYMRLRFKIVKITNKGPNPSVFWCRRDFIDEESKKVNGPVGQANMIWIKCKTAEGMNDFARRIADRELADRLVGGQRCNQGFLEQVCRAFERGDLSAADSQDDVVGNSHAGRATDRRRSGAACSS